MAEPLPASQHLCNGWSQHWCRGDGGEEDQGSPRPFYYNVTTGITQWTVPPDAIEESGRDEGGGGEVNYTALASEYKLSALYREIGGEQLCVVCRTRPALLVFYPCRHQCVCTTCGEECGMQRGEKSGCPICMQVVSFQFMYRGSAEAADRAYQKWVDEVVPPLPKGFKHAFRASAVSLGMKAAGDEYRGSLDLEAEKCCCSCC
jgi:hypothetical protein